MSEHNTNNQPTGSYTPTTGTTVGVDSSPTQGDYAKRQMPLPPMTTGREQGITPIKQTPEGIGHSADQK